MSKKRSTTKRRKQSGVVKIGWRLIAVVSALVTIASVTTLVIVISTKQSDSLASIALVLAILSFVVQLLVYVADSITTSRRDKEARAIYTKTRVLLATIEERTTSTNDAIQTQLGKVFDRFVLNVKSSVDEVSDEGVTDRREVLSVINSAAEDARSQSLNVLARPAAPTRGPGLAESRSRTAASFRLQSRWPIEERVQSLINRGLNDLSDGAKKFLGDLAEDVVLSYENGLSEGLIPADSLLRGAKELASSGFAIRSDDKDFRLSSLGRVAARLWNADGEIPQYVEDLVPWLKGMRGSGQSR